VPLLVLIVGLGFVPSILTNYVNPAVNSMPSMARYQSTPSGSTSTTPATAAGAPNGSAGSNGGGH
jgi:hypothetical protein